MRYKHELLYPSPSAKARVARFLISGNMCKRNQPHPAVGDVWSTLQAWVQRCLVLVPQPRASSPGRCTNSVVIRKKSHRRFCKHVCSLKLCPRVSCSCKKGGSLSFIAEVSGRPKQGSLYCSNLYLI